MFSALIIDNASGAEQIRSALDSAEFEVTSTANAEEAVELARSTPPDIIFLQVELPKASGFVVCNELRRGDTTKYIPLIVYASGLPPEVFRQHEKLQTRADAYLSLPMTDRALLEAVASLIPLALP